MMNSMQWSAAQRVFASARFVQRSIATWRKPCIGALLALLLLLGEAPLRSQQTTPAPNAPTGPSKPSAPAPQTAPASNQQSTATPNPQTSAAPTSPSSSTPISVDVNVVTMLAS